MKKGKTKAKNMSKGITLIALVITIIVLLILAGVSISMLTGENGILTEATKAKDETKKKDLEEQIKLAVGSDKIVDYTEGNGNLEEELKKIENATVEKIAEGTYYVERDEKGYTVYDDGTIEEGRLDIWDGETIEKPETDEQGNWHIYTTGQMKFFANYCNNTLTEEEKTEANMPEITETTTVYLENNLDMGARQKDGNLTTDVKTQWVPVDNFNGMFEGNNHFILGIYVNVNSNGGTGLFVQNKKIIQNLTIKNSYIKSTQQKVGGIVGVAWDKVINCHNDNTVVTSVDNVVGGIVGVNLDGDGIIGCTNTGEIYGKSLLGGIVGYNFENTLLIKDSTNSGKIKGEKAIGGILGSSEFYNVNIEECNNKGEVIGEDERVGGITGVLGRTCNIRNSYNEGEVTGKSNHVGGIVGYISTSATGKIENSYNTGVVTGNGERIGGIAGEISQSSNIINSYNTGTVTGDTYNVGGIAGIIFGTIEGSNNKGKITGKGQVGGIAGQIGMNCEANVRNCYNEGEIIGSTDAIGGIIGWTSLTGTSGTIENTYNKGRIKGVNQVGGIIGRNVGTFVITKSYNKGQVEGTTKVGSVIGEQSNGDDKLSKLYYLKSLNIGGINGEDLADKAMAVDDDINSYEDFLTWIANK